METVLENTDERREVGVLRRGVSPKTRRESVDDTGIFTRSTLRMGHREVEWVNTFHLEDLRVETRIVYRRVFGEY